MRPPPFRIYQTTSGHWVVVERVDARATRYRVVSSAYSKRKNAEREAADRTYRALWPPAQRNLRGLTREVKDAP